MADKLTYIDQKIKFLKKKKEKIQMQQTLLFIKEAQKILKDDFSPEIILVILAEAWSAAPDLQKQEWKKRISSFPLLPFHND